MFVLKCVNFFMHGAGIKFYRSLLTSFVIFNNGKLLVLAFYVCSSGKIFYYTCFALFNYGHDFVFFEIQDQNICAHYSRYGICKFGPACKFDHPLHPASSPMTGVDQHLPYGHSVTTDKAVVPGSGSEATLRQSL